MNKTLYKYGLILIFFVLLAAVVFRCGWGSDKIFNGSDMNIGIIAGAHQVLPARFGGVYGATPVYGGTSSMPMSFLNIGLWLLPPTLFTDTWYSAYLVLSSLFFVAYLRLWKLRWVSCVFGALAAFWMGSITLASTGHLAKIGVMMFFTIALYLVEKAVRATSHSQRIIFSVPAGISVGWMLLEQQDVALFAGLFLGTYAIFRLVQRAPKNVVIWSELLVPIALIGLLMAYSTATKAYTSNVSEVGLKKDPQVKWEFITQWSMVPQEIADLVAPGLMGWKTGHSEEPYRGIIGQSAEWEVDGKGFRNFRLDSLYLGAIPVLLSIFGVFAAFRERREEREFSAAMLCWTGLGLIALVLSFGKYSPVYKLFYQLPLVGNIRAPIKFIHNFQILNAILAAYGLDQLLRKEWNWKRLLILTAGLSALFALFAVGYRSGQFKDWGDFAGAMAHAARMAWLHAAGMLLLLATLFFLMLKRVGAKWITGFSVVLLGAVALDSVMLTGHYFESEDISGLKQGNALIDTLKEGQGDERIYFLDQSGIYNRWLAVEKPYHRLNIFNIWQMPRMPAEYKTLFQAAGRNLPRLWQLASVKYITAPADILEQTKEPLKSRLSPKIYYRFVREGEGVGVQTLSQPEGAQDQVLLEFKDYIPRFSLFTKWESTPLEQHCSTMFSPHFDPLTTVLLDESVGVPEASGTLGSIIPVEAETDLRRATVYTESEYGCILMFTQRYQSDWRVSLDGKPTELLRCNYLCMGVYVPAGTHEVRFDCRK